ncbi:hypothetical protein E1B28_002350 [Marasmius oreades]|uniref:F-box domain-containing protein n=1 Tax=Marasmius oreades TaxID=181124 RepID=A0A9P7RNH4_9AGAR|nr:uncharacterized protein E1B28_002350 [Marasmius oreades]KAG7086395.1 hypothetical protein E1B28_002350 [Marasmius oreades]
MRSLESALRQLRGQQEELRIYAQDHKAILSPARRLFPELWSEIFLWCLPEHLEHHLARRSAGDNITDVSALDAPLLLTRVCSTWREIALSAPKLWSNIAYTVCRPSASKSQLQRLKTWLSRSGITPLSVVICRSFFDANNHLDHPYLYIPDPIPPLSDDPVLQFIFSQSHRWESAEMILPASESAQALVPLMDNLPNLRRLTFGMFWNDTTAASTDSHSNVFIGAFETAPRLEDVAFVEQARLHIALPSSNALTSLSVEALMSPLDAISMLYQYTNLQTCSLNVMTTLSLPTTQLVVDDQRPVLQMRSLTLKLSGNTVCTYGSFLSRLHLPHLSELRIRSYKWVQGQIIPFLEELPPMRSLELSSPSLSAEHLVECLGLPSMRTVEELFVGQGIIFHVPFVPNEPGFANLFRSGRFLPRLEQVGWVCFGNATTGYDAAQIACMLGARMDDVGGQDERSFGRFRSFHLTLNRKWGDLGGRNVFFGFEEFQSRGVYVDVRVRRY